MRRIIFIVLALSLIFSSNLSFAATSNSQHDMYFLGKGTSSNVCSYCHVPHNAVGDKIWSDWGNEAQLSSGPSTIIGNMCYTCHDGTATNVGQGTVFNTVLQQHKISPGEDCDMCHTVHDNTNGMFMKVAKKQDSYCAACHDGIINAGGFGDMTGPGNHPNYWISKPKHDYFGRPTGADCIICHKDSNKKDDGSCYLCHTSHGAADYSTGTISYPILNRDNQLEGMESYYCAVCHPEKNSYAAITDKHPAQKSTSSYGDITCQTCHDVHQPGVTNHPFILVDTNIDSQMCVNCHDGVQGPSIGYSHPYQVPFGDIIPTDGSAAQGTPPANAIDDDGENGPDYPLNSDNLVCESCHGTHRKVDDLGTKLLRITNTNSELCLNCHTDK
jgi:predicted CXXCH cytochrome family protein